MGQGLWVERGKGHHRQPLTRCDEPGRASGPPSPQSRRYHHHPETNISEGEMKTPERGGKGFREAQEGEEDSSSGSGPLCWPRNARSLGVKCSLGIIIARGLLRTQMLRLPPRPTDSEMLEWGSASQALASCPGFEHTASLRSTAQRRIGTGHIEPSR